MAHEYLLKEYELCFAQLRFYDERQETILKYTINLSSAVATAQFAVYQLLKGATTQFFECEAFLCGLVFVATLLLFMAMLQNRLYFVYAARQLNAIRGFLMEVDAPDFKNNQMYTSTRFPALKPLSVHTFLLIGCALISAAFAGGLGYAVLPALNKPSLWWPAVLCFLVVFSAESIGGICYLAKSGNRTADQAIHLGK